MGVILILISIALGYCLTKDFIKIKNPILAFSGAILIGCVSAGTLLYLLDLLFVYTLKNYYISNVIFIILALTYIVFSVKRLDLPGKLKSDIIRLLKDPMTVVVIIIFALFSIWLNYKTFSTDGTDIKDIAAWSDSFYHHAYVRSVSIGHNVPTQYPYFANAPMHWHFLFDYYAGKIAQMGLNSVHALNVMSSLGMFLLLILIYEFGRKYFKSKAVGFLGDLFLIFHSSFSVFKWLHDNFNDHLINKIITNRGWLQAVRFEDWGLMNLSVFQGQKHFAFSLALMVFIALFILIYREKCSKNTDQKPQYDFKRSIFIGLLVGMLPFWNLIVAYVCIIFLGAVAIFNIKNRKFFVEMLGSALIGGLVTLPQLFMFKTGDTVLAHYPIVNIGYGAESSNLLKIVWYYFNVFGIKFLVLIAAVLIIKKFQKLDFLIFSIPFLLANTFQFGSVLYDNNKLIVASVIFINCFAAFAVVWLYRKLHNLIPKVPKIIPAVIPAVLILSMTLAGFIEFFSIKNQPIITIADNSSDLKNWILKNTKPESVFLTNVYIPFNNTPITSICLAGRKLYVVGNDVGSSCDVNPRIKIAKTIYSSNENVNTVKSMMKQEKIDYIVVDDTIRKDLKPDEDFFSKNFKIEYKEGNTFVYSP